MTPADDFPREMDKFPYDGPFDSSDADAVFGASTGSHSIPDALGDVAELVRAARQPGSDAELAGEDVIVAQIAAAVGEHLASPAGDAHERTRVLRKFRTAKVAAAATAALMLGATAAAAATGSLPAPVQSSVASGLSGVGINIPAHHKVELAVKHTATPAHTKGHHPRMRHLPSGAAGVVASVNGVSTANTCGVSAAPGVFTLTGHKGATFTVNVSATTTTFFEKGVTGATFVNVCVGADVFAKGTVSGTTVTATSVQIVPVRHKNDDHHHGVLGTVTSVNGSTTANTCGQAMMSGTFVVTGHKGATFTVSVDTSTKFNEPGVTSASFLNVCVGAKVAATGAVTGTTVAATNVFVLPAHFGGFHGFHPRKGGGHFPKGFEFKGKQPAGPDHDGTATTGTPKTGVHDKGGSHGKGKSGAKHGH